LPTSDRLVMLRLRECGEPVMLFGEPPELRRDRLRETLVRLGSDRGMPLAAETEDEHAKKTAKDDELYYTTGAQTLRNVRQWVLASSLARYNCFLF